MRKQVGRISSEDPEESKKLARVETSVGLSASYKNPLLPDGQGRILRQGFCSTGSPHLGVRQCKNKKRSGGSFGRRMRTCR